MDAVVMAVYLRFSGKNTVGCVLPGSDMFSLLLSVGLDVERCDGGFYIYDDSLLLVSVSPPYIGDDGICRHIKPAQIAVDALRLMGK